MVTITRYLQRIEQSAALMGGSVEDALAADIDGEVETPKEVRLPYKD